MASWKFVVGSSVCLTSLSATAFPSQASQVQNTAGSKSSSAAGSRGIGIGSQNLDVLRRRLHSRSAAHAEIAQGNHRNLPVSAKAPRRRGNSPQPSGLRYITVESGDTLWGISRRLGISLADLERWNHLSVDSILHIGQKLATTRVADGIVRPLSSRGESATAPLADGVLGEQIAQYALRFIGVPYQWGGVDSRGFDCSGLVEFVFAHFGVSTGRTSYAQYDGGSLVYKVDLIPGDLVFFNTYGSGASHVGIYVGSDRFVSAAGDEVRVDTLSEAYWRDHFIGARRIR